MSPGSRQIRYAGSGGFSAGIALILVLFILACVGALWVYQGMTTQARWPIRWLEIDGPFQRVSAEQLRARLAPLTTGSYFTVDTGRLRSAVAKMPWVAHVKIRKIWPDTIQVTVFEYTPVAHWVDGSLVAADGHAFEVAAADGIQGLPWLKGPPSQLPVVFENWQKIDKELVVIGQHTEKLSLDARGSWSVLLNGGTEVRLGKGDIFKRLDTLVKTWGELMGAKPLPPISVDLRYTNGFAVLWPTETDKIAGNYGEKN